MTENALHSRSGTNLQEWVDSGWQSGFLRPLLIAVLAACFVAGPIALVTALVPQAGVGPILPLCFLGALIAVYSTQWMAKPAQRLLNKMAFRMGQFVLLVVVVRLATWLIRNDWPDLADARQWLLDPLSFFDAYFLATVFLAVVAWDRSAYIAGIFYELALTPGELAWFDEQRKNITARRYAMEIVRKPRQVLYENFISHWLIGGALLVFCAGLSQTRVDRSAGVNLLNLGMPPQIIAVVVAYFLIGLILASQARLAVLRAQWLHEGADQAPDVPGRWQRLALGLVLVIGLVATLLPLGSTWQIGQILSIIVVVVAQAIYAIVFGVLTAIFALLSLLGLVPPAAEELAQGPPMEPLQATPPATTSAIPAWLPGAGFWLIALAAVIYAVVYVLGKQGIALNREGLRRAWRALLERLRGWWLSVRHAASSIQINLPLRRSQEEEEASAGRPWRFIRLGALPPREKIRYFYLSTVRRASERGVVRRASQTPAEFARDLEAAWPEAEVDVEALTEAFVVARYDASDISPPEAKEVQSIWERVKQALRRRTPGKEAPLD